MADTTADYQLVKILGRGAFGEAVLYRRLEDNSLVVWKEILLMNASEKQRHHAMQEASLLSLLSHPNIIAYYNDFMDGSTLLIEMEYANGGTLNRKVYTGLANEELFAERWILWMFYQIASAVNYVHQRQIIHRDIKSLNIFLTKLGLCKLGDFGLARSLSASERQGVTSNVGTVAYMSPEIYKGEIYNEGSDVWAVGCVLYEMAARRLPFASNEIGRLAVEIVETTPKELDDKYSGELRRLCMAMLEKDPTKRLSIADVLTSEPLIQLKEEFGPEVVRLDRTSSKSNSKKQSLPYRESYPVVTSKSSEVFVWGGGRHVPQRMEALTKATAAMQVAAGIRHFVALTVEKEVFTWAVSQGDGKMLGQLGHGDLAMYRKPRRIDSLCGQAIIQVACGDEFSILLTDGGHVYAFGTNYWGCLGNGGEVETDVIEPRPTLVAFFSAETDATRVRRIAAGATFVFAATVSGDLYSWGNGDMGQLGLGSEECHSSPQKVKLPPGGALRRVICGTDNAFAVMKSGRLLACGSNENNKCCLNQSIGPRRASINSGEPAITTVHMQLDFQPVKALRRFRIVNVAAGHSHSAAIDIFGHLHTFGDNTYGQLGSGNFREQRGAKRVAGTLLGKEIVHASCGDGFTMVGSTDQHVYSWGRGDHGQLCSTTASSSSSSTSNQRTGNALPRPVFSALHVVSGLSCKRWHGIMIAEKVLSTRTLNNTISPMRDQDGSLDFSESYQSQTQSMYGGAAGAANDTEEIPSWVAEELGQSFIPMPTRGSSASSQIGRLGASSPAVLLPSVRHSGGLTDQPDSVAGSASPRRASRGLAPAASSSVRKHSPLRSTVSTPASVSQRAGSPGRKSVLSVEPPAPGASVIQYRHQRQSSPPTASTASTTAAATAAAAGSTGRDSPRRKSAGQHSPLLRSTSDGKAHAVDSAGLDDMTELERLRRQVADLQHERDTWKREAESLQGDRQQLTREIDVAAEKVADLKRMNTRLRSAHKDIEQLYHAWLKEVNAAVPGAIQLGGRGAPSAASGSASGAAILEARTVGAPAFRGVSKSPKSSRRRVVAPVRSLGSASPPRSQDGAPGGRDSPAAANSPAAGTKQASPGGHKGLSSLSTKGTSASRSSPPSPWHKASEGERTSSTSTRPRPSEPKSPRGSQRLSSKSSPKQ